MLATELPSFHMTDETIFLDKASFSKLIEERVKSGATYFDAIVEFCEANDREPKDVMKLLQPVLLQKVKQSAIEQGLFTPPKSGESII